MEVRRPAGPPELKMSEQRSSWIYAFLKRRATINADRYISTLVSLPKQIKAKKRSFLMRTLTSFSIQGPTEPKLHFANSIKKSWPFQPCLSLRDSLVFGEFERTYYNWIIGWRMTRMDDGSSIRFTHNHKNSSAGIRRQIHHREKCDANCGEYILFL